MKEGDFLATLSENVIKNDALSHADAGLYAGSRHGCQAVIAGAGPSLPSDLEQLLACPRDAYDLMAVGAAYRQVAAAGLTPDYIVTCDPSDATQPQFAIDPMIAAALPPLIFEISSNPGLIQHQGRIRPLITCGLEDGAFSPIWLALGRAGVSAWGTVLSVALGVAHLWRYSQVVFIGADMSFQPMGPTHADLSPGCRRIDPAAIPISEVPRMAYDAAGRQVITTHRLRQYAAFLAEQCKAETAIYGTRHINATSGGVWAEIERAGIRTSIAAAGHRKGRMAIHGADGWWWMQPGMPQRAQRNLMRLQVAIEHTAADAILDPAARNLIPEVFGLVYGARAEDIRALRDTGQRDQAIAAVTEAKHDVISILGSVSDYIGQRM